MKKIALFIFLIFFIFCPGVNATVTITPVEKDIIAIMQYAIRLSIIEVDMSLPIGWMNDDRDSWPEFSKEALAKIDRVQKDVNGHLWTPELFDLKDSFIEITSHLAQIYQEIAAKPSDQIEYEMKQYWRESETYNAKLQVLVDRYFKFPEDIPQDFSYKNTLPEYFSTDDRKVFLLIEQLMKDKKFAAAHEKISLLLEKYKDKTAEGILLERNITCLFHFDTDIESKDDEKIITEAESAVRLKQLLDNGQYYPNLYVIFQQWRALEQAANYGMSNWSEIPNDLYETKRQQAFDAMMKHIETNNQDDWAKIQIIALMNIPLIERGGFLGNKNLEHMAHLFMDMDKDEEKENGE